MSLRKNLASVTSEKGRKGDPGGGPALPNNVVWGLRWSEATGVISPTISATSWTLKLVQLGFFRIITSLHGEHLGKFQSGFYAKLRSSTLLWPVSIGNLLFIRCSPAECHRPLSSVKTLWIHGSNHAGENKPVLLEVFHIIVLSDVLVGHDSHSFSPVWWTERDIPCGFKTTALWMNCHSHKDSWALLINPANPQAAVPLIVFLNLLIPFHLKSLCGFKSNLPFGIFLPLSPCFVLSKTENMGKSNFRLILGVLMPSFASAGHGLLQYN